MSVAHERRTRSRVFGFSILASLFVVIATLWGCATPLLVAGATSAVLTGKGLHDHALSGVTSKDCKTLEGAVREDRELCEERDSAAAEKDFKGILGFFEGRKEARVYEGQVAERQVSEPVSQPYEAPQSPAANSEPETFADPAPLVEQATAKPVRSQQTQVASAKTGITSDLYESGQPYAVFDKSGYVGVRVIPYPVPKPL